MFGALLIYLSPSLHLLESFTLFALFKLEDFALLQWVMLNSLSVQQAAERSLYSLLMSILFEIFSNPFFFWISQLIARLCMNTVKRSAEQ